MQVHHKKRVKLTNIPNRKKAQGAIIRQTENRLNQKSLSHLKCESKSQTQISQIKQLHNQLRPSPLQVKEVLT